MECQHPTCQRTLVIDCLKPDFFEIYPSWRELDREECQTLVQDFMVYYCLEHCQNYGYCWGCGIYCGNTIAGKLDKSGLCHPCQLKTLLSS